MKDLHFTRNFFGGMFFCVVAILLERCEGIFFVQTKGLETQNHHQFQVGEIDTGEILATSDR